jgi:hypothetical protein
MKNVTSSLPGFFLLSLSAILFFGQCGQPASKQSLFDTFHDKNPVHLTVETDLSALLADQKPDDWQPAGLKMQKTACKEFTFDGKVKPRGVFRKANCSFPPLKLKFEKDAMKELDLKEYRTLKLVTHCQEDYEYEQFVLKEFLAFKLYNELTDRSFRVQLANVRYVDSQKKLPDIERYGFLIEDDEELAERLGGSILGEEHGDPKTIDKPQYKLFALFQFMIGNTDWSLANRHNTELLQPNNTDLPMPFPVPYDFDFCGMVDAPYAIAPHHLPISDVKERFFQWRGKQGEDFTETFALFQSKKDAMLREVQGFELLSEQCRADVTAYLESFFEMLETPEKIVGR